MNGRALSPARVAEVVREACCLDMQALKPGNVGTHADGHGMTVEDFLRSADAVAPELSRAGVTVGDRIRRSMEATLARVHCNTNLGIVLLLAPLAHAVLTPSPAGSLRERLGAVLASLTADDAVGAYAAIRAARPGGVGSAAQQDVAERPTVTLLEAMRLAAGRDRIAHQYASDYEDVFTAGLPALREALKQGLNREWATAVCYLRYVSRFPDTHVARKFGAAAAERIRKRAAAVESRVKACDNPLTAVPMLLGWDEELKAGGFNPGTSADLTVATLAACRFETLLS